MRTLGLASGRKGPDLVVSKEVVVDAFSVVVFAEIAADIVGLLKLFWRVTRALVAEQSRGV